MFWFWDKFWLSVWCKDFFFLSQYKDDRFLQGQTKSMHAHTWLKHAQPLSWLPREREYVCVCVCFLVMRGSRDSSVLLNCHSACLCACVRFDLFLCMSLLTPHKRLIISPAGKPLQIAHALHITLCISVCVRVCVITEAPQHLGWYHNCRSLNVKSDAYIVTVWQRQNKVNKDVFTHKQHWIFFYFFLYSISSFSAVWT